MAGTVEENAAAIMEMLANLPRDEMGSADAAGDLIAENTGLGAAEINDAVTILVEGGYAEWQQYLGTAPYAFAEISLTPRGRFEYEKSLKASRSGSAGEPRTMRPPNPVGSPYGFQDHDWEILSERKGQMDRLYVVLGYQFQSDNYDSENLKRNIENMFSRAVDLYNKLPGVIKCILDFHPLAAGYGEHLFNEIARDIIAADVAVFDTSDLNPNVMVEMGVALTWGVRVLPIKKNSCPRPPSDISGQTWADYDDSGRVFLDRDHETKLLRLIERAIRKKGRA